MQTDYNKIIKLINISKTNKEHRHNTAHKTMYNIHRHRAMGGIRGQLTLQICSLPQNLTVNILTAIFIQYFKPGHLLADFIDLGAHVVKAIVRLAGV